MPSWLYYPGRAVVHVFFLLFTRLTVVGRRNIPAGAVLVSSNHLNLIDPIVVGFALGRPCVFMAKEELFRSKLSGWFVGCFGAFPVHRGRLDREALRLAGNALDREKVLVMFPEGARATSEGHRPEGFLGAALIASRANAPVLPVGISGTALVTGWRWMLRRPRITVNIGRPLTLPAFSGKTRREELERYTHEIMQRIGMLAETQSGQTERD
jgi:1-acyl-sn-glycerol-3-phosphate acyltransferase